MQLELSDDKEKPKWRRWTNSLVAGLLTLAIVGIVVSVNLSSLQRGIHQLGVGSTLFYAVLVLLGCVAFIARYWDKRYVETWPYC